MNIEQLEIDLLFEGIFHLYGYDFRNYSPGSARRRVEHRMSVEGLKTISEVQHLALHDEEFMNRLLKDLSINVTSMFRDPEFYLSVREKVTPILKKFQDDCGHIKIWHAGCSTGEEVFSMAILMREKKLIEHALMYATDFNNKILTQAKRAIIPLNAMQENISNYQKAGGNTNFSNYYHANYDGAQLDKSLTDNIVFSNHNLVTDSSFGEMQMITCRNVLIYFNRKLQERVFQLFDESLCCGGILCLGSKESLRFSPMMARYETLSKQQRIYRKL